MKINKKALLAATLIGATFFMTGCETGVVGDNPPQVSANPITERYTFKNAEGGYKIKYANPWRAISEEGYDLALIPGTDTENSVIKLAIKGSEVTEETNELDKAASYYEQTIMNTGIVSRSKFTIKDAEGYWISYSTLEESGVEVEGIKEEAKTADEIIELGVVVKDNKAYVFKVSAKDSTSMQNYKQEVLSLLEGFKFL